MNHGEKAIPLKRQLLKCMIKYFEHFVMIVSCIKNLILLNISICILIISAEILKATSLLLIIIIFSKIYSVVSNTTTVLCAMLQFVFSY